MHCDKPAGSYCRRSHHACDANPHDPTHGLHEGNESLVACQALCTANAQCDCLSYTTADPKGKAKSLCKTFRGVTSLKAIDHRDAYVPAGKEASAAPD